MADRPGSWRNDEIALPLSTRVLSCRCITVECGVLDVHDASEGSHVGVAGEGLGGDA